MSLSISQYIFRGMSRLRSIFTGYVLLLIVMLSSSGCGIDRLLESGEPPDGTVIDPSLVKTRDGALRVKTAATLGLVKALTDASLSTAIFTDELTADETNRSDITSLDARIRTNESIPGTILSPSYINFHVARVTSAQAIALLKTYGNSQDSASIAESYIIQGKSILYLAEMYCSGIPLTRVPLDGDLQYTRGMSTAELFETANFLFDTSIAYAGDSVLISSAAKIGKGRALVNLGRFSEARGAVEGVETEYQYAVRYSSSSPLFWTGSGVNANTREVINNEGDNGLDWISTPPAAQDPRVPLSAFPHRQLKYVGTTVTFSVAKGAEARMIEAEALLQPANAPSGDWLAPINIARATVGLPALSDPGSANSRVDLLFHERGFWFFLEGRRLGDLRRLVRQYNRLPMTVYPTGPYTRGLWQIPAYETNYVFSPPNSEQERNPFYSGCDNLEP